MGLLKHVVCPFFSIANGGAALYALTGATPAIFAELFGLPLVATVAEESSVDEKSYRVAAGAFHVASAVLMAVGSVWETAHVRGIIIGYECILQAAALVGGLSLQTSLSKPSFALLPLALASALVHAMEPGIFTKDKGSN
jgi:hypothetical protein